jgi:hypothetical protein
MELPDFKIEQLKQLPLRAIVAFAARCARRVEPLARRHGGESGTEGAPAAIEAALRMAEDFARGAEAAPDPSVIEAIDALEIASAASLGTWHAVAAAADVAHAAAVAWRSSGTAEIVGYEPVEGVPQGSRKFLGDLASVTADLAAFEAFTAAVRANDAIGYSNEEFVAAARDDYNKLLGLDLGRYPDRGKPIDPSPGGLLGPL